MVKKAVSVKDDKKILLVGDAQKAFCGSSFFDHGSLMNYELVNMPSLADAIGAAVVQKCAVIAIVISGNLVKLKSGIKALRHTCNSRIVLLAQMHEEPIAIDLTNFTYNGVPLVDDYLICPARREEFADLLDDSQDDGAAENGVTEAVDSERIRLLEEMATEDDLTGLKNRRYIWEFSRQVINHAGNENKRVTLLVFDIDDFKRYNDIYGHYAGDEILKQAGALMRRCCRSHDIIGRIGGDEFAVIFWDNSLIPDKTRFERLNAAQERRSATADHPDEAISIARRFVKELEKTPASVTDGGGLGPEGRGVLTISGGLASFPRDGLTAQELFRQADRALLEAKRSGKNRIYLVGSPQTSADSVGSGDIHSS
ncbi:MAG: GGDEF domain-containing protein [Sedimentisphaerales bacterium]|nr:GGDEF domain-containing protein [Sedimentisphaerales bacterium]